MATRARKPNSSRDAVRTQESLLAAGTELFAELGYKGATVDRIARRARVNKAMINYHFGGKLGLYRAILADTLVAVTKRLADLRGSSLTADQRLRAFVEIFAGEAARRPRFPSLMLREVLTGAKHMDERAVGLVLSVAALVREIVEQGVREGTFRPVDPLFTHLSLVGSLVFFFATASFRERLIEERRLPPSRAEDYVHHVQDLVTRGLLAPVSTQKGR